MGEQPQHQNHQALGEQPDELLSNQQILDNHLEEEISHIARPTDHLEENGNVVGESTIHNISEMLKKYEEEISKTINLYESLHNQIQQIHPENE